MAHDDAAPVVDFVVGDERGPGRPAPPTAPGPDRHRPRRPFLALVALVALAGGAVLVRAATTHDRPAAASRQSPSPSSPSSTAESPSAPGPAANAPAPAGGVRVGGRFYFCPQFTACAVLGRLPGAVLQAVRAQFPGAAVRSATTVLAQHDNGPTDVSQRTVVARAGAITITVLVRAKGVPGGSGRQGDRQVTRESSDGHYVTVTADVAGSAPPPAYERLDQLVADDRLLAQ